MTTRCRVCGGSDARVLLDFGPQPNSLRLLPAQDTPHRLHPLVLHHCPACGFIFIADPLPAEEFYGEVQLSTSVFPARHLEPLCAELVQRLSVTSQPRILEIGCNDGYFLDRLRQAGFTRLRGVEPSAGCADQARVRGLEVDTDYFSARKAQELLAKDGNPDLVICRHVLEHVLDLSDFLEGLSLLLEGGGLLLLEVPDLGAIEARGDFSAIWEQHVNYFDLPVLRHLSARFNLRVEEVRRLDYGGGTLFSCIRRGAESVAIFSSDREQLRRRVLANIRECRETVSALREGGQRIAAFGAGMRGAMLINLAGLGPALAFVVDDNPTKVGRWLTGSRLPILPSSALDSERPDACIVLPMNAKAMEHAIEERHARQRAAGMGFYEVLPEHGGFLRPFGQPVSCGRSLES